MSGEIASSKLLEYEQEILSEMYELNALLILCEGLGMDRIFLTFLRLYSDLKELVFVLNTLPSEQEYFIDQLKLIGVKKIPQNITSENGIAERKLMYARGGVYFVSARIMVMDLLMNRIPIDLVTGILVAKAHKVVDSCQISFIMRLFRQKNKTGFIKAFTDQPVSFMDGFSKLEKTLKALFVGNVLIYPRFHASVLKCFKKHKPEVIEINVNLTEDMRRVQMSLLEIISACLRELKTDNPGVDTDGFTLENSLGQAFDKSMRRQLDPMWNQLSAKTKTLVNDLRLLRLLLRALTQYDSVTFLKMLETATRNERAFGKNPGWMFMDAADKLFYHAKKRVHGESKKNAKTSSKEEDTIKDPFLEMPPKWAVLTDILKEIKEANTKTSDTIGAGKTLICASDARTSYLLQNYLCFGGRTTMVQIYNRVFKKSLSVINPESGNTSMLALQQNFEAEEDWLDENEDRPTVKYIGKKVTKRSAKNDKNGQSKQLKLEVEKTATWVKGCEDPETYIHSLYGNANPYDLAQCLEELSPRYVILYDSNITFVRQLEVHKACRPGMPFRVYFMTYESSTEEQVYLTALQREKKAFYTLIQEKGTMVIPKEIEGKTEDAPQLLRDPSPAYQGHSQSRKAGGQKSTEQQVIVVDMREFRSSLPSILHKRGIDIEPITIEVGDYILTPDICIERKSLSDLIGSLNSGRLYNQCVSMSRHYKKPMLLIEFDAKKAFSFKARGVTGHGRMTVQELNQKLTLLLLHFPMLRLAWSPSPEAAAEFFHEVKIGREQPDPAKASAAGNASGEESYDNICRKYNIAAYDFLLTLPGIDAINCRRILHHVKNLKELCEVSELQLSKLLDSKTNGKQLYEFLHKNYGTASVESTNPTTSKETKSSTFKEIKTAKITKNFRTSTKS